MFSEMFVCCFLMLYICSPAFSNICSRFRTKYANCSKSRLNIWQKRNCIYNFAISAHMLWQSQDIYFPPNQERKNGNITLYHICNTTQYTTMQYHTIWRSVPLFAYRCTSKYQILRNRTCHIKLTYIQGKHFQIDFFLIYISMIKVWRSCSVSISR